MVTLKSTMGKPAKYPFSAASIMPFPTAGMKFLGMDPPVLPPSGPPLA